MELFLLLLLAAFVVAYRLFNGNNVSEFVKEKGAVIINKFAPYSFKVVNEKTKRLGQEYKFKDYVVHCVALGAFAAGVSYIYFYDLKVCILYIVVAVMLVPYLAFLRSKRIYSEFLFEQVQVYTTNTIMEFATTQSFVKSLEGVYESGVLEDPVLSDVKTMIDLAYENGTIDASIEFMNSKYDYFIVRNMHQLFLQITNEGSKNSSDALENMSLDIDMLVENVYRDRLDRQAFHRQFVQYGVILYALIMLIQLLLGTESYINMLDMWFVRILVNLIVVINTYFLLSGEKYYNENVGAE